jgi:Uma2 family endonuclease
MASPVRTKPDAAVPPLETGQRLTREEFERRYDAMADLKKAELIEGVVYVGSPVRFDHHARPHAVLMGWLMTYWFQTPGVEVADNGTVRLDERNEPQPDAALMIERGCGGRAQVSADDYVEGAPELVAEVSASSVRLDLGPRLDAYRRNGVQEYVVWRVDDAAVDWFVLRAGQYERLPLTEGAYRSEVFPGLWLDPAALIATDRAAVLRVLQQGLASAEHAAFVVRLQQRSAIPP